MASRHGVCGLPQYFRLAFRQGLRVASTNIGSTVTRSNNGGLASSLACWYRPQPSMGAGPAQVNAAPSVRLLSGPTYENEFDNDGEEEDDDDANDNVYSFGDDYFPDADDTGDAWSASTSIDDLQDSWASRHLDGTWQEDETEQFLGDYHRSRNNNILLSKFEVLKSKGCRTIRIEDIVTAVRKRHDGLAEANRIKIFNFLMRSWLSEGKPIRAQQTLKNVGTQCELDAESYFLLILSHAMSYKEGLVSTAETASKIRATIQRMHRAGFSLRKFSSVYDLEFMDMTPEQVIDAIRLVWPDFELIPEKHKKINKVSNEYATNDQWSNELAIIMNVPVPETISEKNKKRTRKKPDERPKRENARLFVLEPFKKEIVERMAEARLEWTQENIEKGVRISRMGPTRTQYDAGVPTDLAFTACDDEELAELTLGVLEFFLIGSGIPVDTWVVNQSVGNAIYLRSFIKNSGGRAMKYTTRTFYDDYVKAMHMNPKGKGREIWNDLLAKYNLNTDHFDIDYIWPKATMRAVGEMLINIVLENASIRTTGHPHDAPAFVASYEFGVWRGQMSRVYKVHPILGSKSNMYSTDESTKPFLSSSLPMLTPPKPWINLQSSPLLTTPRPMVRTGIDHYEHKALVARCSSSLSKVYDALNHLSSCAWRINDYVLDQQLAIYESEEGAEDLCFPPLQLDDTSPKLSREEIFDLEPSERRFYNERKRIFKKSRNENYSLRSALVNKISVASAYRDKVFYFPHNMDFRGRTYTIGPYLSHLDDDKTRSLLRFATAKPLGEKGLRWLKIHTASLCGVDKCSFDDRVSFVERNFDSIMDSAKNPWGPPLEGEQTKFWRASENPWQTLAACNELRDAYASGDPVNFNSALPIHQDGTCNGLQHYAALGCDPQGAIAVNLASNLEDRPSDVYMGVAHKVNDLLRQHAAGNFDNTTDAMIRTVKMKHDRNKEVTPRDYQALMELANDILTETPNGVERKIIKQSVMTSVYGVTEYGARAQIRKQLDAKKFFAYDEEGMRTAIAAAYLTELTFTSLDSMFEKANHIKRWLGDAAHQIALSNKPVQWITPLNFPVIQQYSKWRGFGRGRELIPNARKQKSAFPPNFVHSLDSTHMMITANLCNDQGLNFVSVHDSYWTHAADIDTMNKLTREAFVTLHEQPILERLYLYFSMYHNGDECDGGGIVDIPPPPVKGDFDLKEVLESKYFFN